MFLPMPSLSLVRSPDSGWASVVGTSWSGETSPDFSRATGMARFRASSGWTGKFSERQDSYALLSHLAFTSSAPARRRRGVAVIVAAAVLLFGLAACGSGDSR